MKLKWYEVETAQTMVREDERTKANAEYSAAIARGETVTMTMRRIVGTAAEIANYFGGSDSTAVATRTTLRSFDASTATETITRTAKVRK